MNPRSGIDYTRQIVRWGILVEAYYSCLRQVYPDHDFFELGDQVEYLHRLLIHFFHKPALTIVDHISQSCDDGAPLL